MKLLAAITAIIFVAFVSAELSVDEALLVRANALVDATRKVIEELREQNRSHIVSTLEHQVVVLEALLIDLAKTENRSLHKRHMLEEDLLHIENRIAEELVIIHEFDEHHHHHHHDNMTAHELIEQANKVVQAAKHVLATQPNVKEASELKAEIAVIEKVVNELLSETTMDAAQLKRDAQILWKHERTIRQILDRIDRRNHSHPDPWFPDPDHRS